VVRGAKGGRAGGAVVDLEAVPEVPAAASVTVEPADSDDWELVELHAGHMEEQILNQARPSFPVMPLCAHV